MLPWQISPAASSPLLALATGIVPRGVSLGPAPGVQSADNRRQHWRRRLRDEHAEIAEPRHTQQDGKAHPADKGVRERVRKHHLRCPHGEREGVENIHRRIEEAVHTAGDSKIENRSVHHDGRLRSERRDELRGEDLDDHLHGERHGDGEGEPDAQRQNGASRPIGSYALRGGGGDRLPDRPTGKAREGARLETHARRRGDVCAVGVQKRGDDHVGDVDDRLLHGARRAQAKHLERLRPRVAQGWGEGSGSGEASAGDGERHRAGGALRGDRRPCRARYPHAEPRDEREIESDVARSGENHREHWRSRIALSPEECAGGVHEERAAGKPADDTDVESGVGGRLCRHAHGVEQRASAQNRSCGNRHGEDGADGEKRSKRPALAADVSGADSARKDRAASRREPYHDRADDEGDRRCVAYGDERRFAQDMTDDGHVGELVEVLQKIGGHEGRRE